MKHTSTALVILASLLITPQLAQAQSSGPYISGALGLSQLRDLDISGSGINTEMDSKRGYALSGAYGFDYGNSWRAEGELSYRKSKVDGIAGGAGSGDAAAFGLMANGYYDFLSDSLWSPYLGAGIGAAQVSFDGVSPVGGSQIDKSDWALAYQGIAGVAYQVSDQAKLFTEYRYVATTGVDLRINSGVNVDADSQEHRFMVGMRWSFSKPKPKVMAKVVAAVTAPEPAPEPVKVQPVEPAPPPPVVETRYLVFFDWDSADVTEGVSAILQQVVLNSRKIKLTGIDTVGHADRSGTTRYNLALSQRRAEAVQTELVRLGAPKTEFRSQWRGELEPLVQTDDGTREPQNRRVEILLK